MAYQFDPSWSMFVKLTDGSLHYVTLQELLAEQQLGFDDWVLETGEAFKLTPTQAVPCVQVTIEGQPEPRLIGQSNNFTAGDKLLPVSAVTKGSRVDVDLGRTRGLTVSRYKKTSLIQIDTEAKLIQVNSVVFVA